MSNFAKLTITGVEFRLSDYLTPLKNKGGRKYVKPDDEQIVKPEVTSAQRLVFSKKNSYNAKKKFIDLVNSNPDLNKFLTLTFHENLQDIEKANYEFKKFIQRLERLYPHLKYVCGIEFQKRGAVHYHIITNLPYIDVNYLAEKYWGNRFIKLNRIDHVDNLGKYISKYLTKAYEDIRLTNKKKYFSSRNLLRPIRLYDDLAVFIFYFINEYKQVLFQFKQDHMFDYRFKDGSLDGIAKYFSKLKCLYSTKYDISNDYIQMMLYYVKVSNFDWFGFYNFIASIQKTFSPLIKMGV